MTATDKVAGKQRRTVDRRIAIAVTAIAIVLIIIYLYTTFFSPSPLDKFKSDCMTACSADQQSGIPVSFCNYQTTINNVTYTCPSAGLTCNINGTVYDNTTCQGENPYQIVAT